MCRAQQDPEFVGEPHGGPDVPGPAIRIGGLVVGHPGAGDVGQHRNSRRVQRQGGEILGERWQYRVHGLGVEGVRRADPPGQDALVGQTIGEFPDRVLGACHHAAARFVDRGNVDLRGQMIGDVVGSGRHGDHGARRCGVHQAGPHRNHLDRRRQVEDTRDGGGHQFADAVSGERFGGDTVGHDQLSQCVFHREQCGLSEIGGLQFLSIEHLCEQVDTEFGGEAFRAPVEVLPEHRLGLVQSARHADVLGALAGEQERDPVRTRRSVWTLPDRDIVVFGGGQDRGGIGTVVGDRDHPVFLGTPPRQCECHVSQRKIFVAGQFLGQRDPGLL